MTTEQQQLESRYEFVTLESLDDKTRQLTHASHDVMLCTVLNCVESLDDNTFNFIFYSRQTFTSELAEMRSLFEAELERTPTAFHQIDIDRVRTDDWQLLGFLQRSTSATEAYELLSIALLWKKHIGVHEKRDEDFPLEFYKVKVLETNFLKIYFLITVEWSRNFGPR